MRTLIIRLIIILTMATVPMRGFAQDSIPKIDEWKEIFKLRSKMMKGDCGSNYLIGLFDGRFIGPNKQTDFGLRTYTTAFDYLTLGNTLLTLFVNLGYTADNCKFISTDKMSNMHSYMLGCIEFYAISEEKRWVDSVYSTKLGRKVPADKPFFAKNSHLRIDSAQVEVKLAGIYRKMKSGKETISDTMLLKPIEGTGSWKDANNFDLIYEWMEVIYNNTIDSFNIKRRPFSRYTPEAIQQCILERYDTKKYTDEKKISERDLDCKIKDISGAEIYDMRHFPNGKVFRMGNWEMFRYFYDVYYRDISGGATKKNPVWYNAYQYDDDLERNRKGMIEFIQLSYGAGRYTMPTVVPKNLKEFTQFEGVVIYQKGTERQGHSSNDDIWINTINGRMVDRNLYEYPSEQGILPLNDDGTVDRIYKIFSWKDGKLYWAYIYCGKHAGVRGGKPGKSFVDQVDNFREQYNARDYWHFVSELDYNKDIKERMPAFVKEVKSYVDKASGIAGKTIPSIQFVMKQPGEKKGQEIITVKTLNFNTDYTATLEPDGLIIPWKIVQTTDERLVKVNHIQMNVLDEDVYLEDFEDYIKSHEFSNSEIQRFNKRLKKSREMVPLSDSLPVTTAYYDKQVYDLTNSEDMKALLEKVLLDIAAIDYQIPEMSAAVEWQRTKKVDAQETKIREMEANGKAGTQDYNNAIAEFDLQQEKLESMEQKLLNLEAKKEQLLSLKQNYRTNYLNSLQENLQTMQTRISFINDQIANLELERKTLEREGKTGTDAYELIQQSLKNKESELQEVKDKEIELQKTIAEQQNTDG